MGDSRVRASTTPCRSLLAFGLLGLTGQALAAESAPSRVEDLRGLSIEQLADVQVTSVTKSAQSLREAPAAIYVITHDDIIRSGATSIPEMLRLAPNLQVAQTSATSYTVTARGFSGNAADQTYSDKLLVLIDGRSVYTPLFSGVYWDMQDVPAEDIDRIEVISGPGAALWGANAVNGVINIITRKAAETQGGVIEAGVGNQQRGFSLQYGGRLSSQLAYRLYVKDFHYDDTVTPAGARVADGGSKPQGGGRVDWTPTAHDVVTLQGDDYEGSHLQNGAPDEDISGANVMARWNHTWKAGQTLQIQAYWDRTARGTENGGGSFALDTYDLDVQGAFALGHANQVVAGAGVRRAAYDIIGTTTLFFLPPRADLDLVNAFVQDSVSLSPTLGLVAGLKLESDPYSGLSVLPDVRFSWRPTSDALVWAAASRAIRSPTPFDTNVVEKLGQTVFLHASPKFESEKLTAYELGGRLQASARTTFSLSAYYNIYDDVRTIEPAPGSFIPLAWGNGIRGDTWGMEAWSDYQIAAWWRLTASVSVLREHLTFKPGASRLLGVAQIGDDPRQQASLRSTMDLGRHVTLDADLRYVDALPNPSVPAYVELGARIAWDISDRVQVSVAGFNLLHDHHLEFPAPQASAVPRSVYAAIRLRF